jgi:hypothetical protein
MEPSQHTTRAVQPEFELQRWADDGGFIPGRETLRTPVPTRSPWRAVGIAAALGFVIGWITSPGPRGGRDG